MVIKQIEETLKEILLNKGIESEEIENMDVTLADLGLGSLEFMDISVALNKKFGYLIRLSSSQQFSLKEICEEIYKHM